MDRIKKFLKTLSPEAVEPIKERWPELWDTHNGMSIETIHYGRNEVKIIPRFRDMNPDLSFWIDTSNMGIDWNDQTENPLTDLGIPYDGRMFWMQGKFWVDEYDNKDFKPKIHKSANAYLVKIEWGGPNDSTRGAEWDLLAPLAWHSKRATSKNGKMGCNYYVFSSRFKYEPAPNIEETIKNLREGY